jgi:hypothetical protein
MGDVISHAQALAELDNEVNKMCTPCINSEVKVPLTQGQFDALASFIYNCGVGAFKGSTLLQLLNLKDYRGASDQLLRWNKVDGGVNNGLVRRREQERALFLTGVEVNPAYPILMMGDRGDAVKSVQEMLITLTYTGVEADGIFGAYTESAVKRFQGNMSLVVDGIVGPATWEILVRRTTNQPSPVEDAWSGLNGNYAVTTRLNKRDGYGLELLKTTVYKEGKSIGSVSMVSGQAYAQTFRKGKETYAGSMEPAPELREGYKIHDIQWSGGKDNYSGSVHSSGLGPWLVWLEEDRSDCRRSEICFHQDWNRSYSPGSAGCLCTTCLEDSKKLIALLRQADPKKLFVDWGLNYVKKSL